MSGNKYQDNLKIDVKEVEIRYTDLYGDLTLFKGTINQAIRHLIKLAN
tara:strand:+ start:3011 stop:3154 length:144 start_codon:yes stop_codon:yes gene_type:complete